MTPPRPAGSTGSDPAGAARLLAAAGMVALLGGMAAIVISSRGTDDGLPATVTTTATAAETEVLSTRPATGQPKRMPKPGEPYAYR